MIIRPRTRPQTLLQAFVSPICSSSRQQCRSKHSVPKLQHNRDEVFAKYGVPGFLSANTYNETWLKYQGHLCQYIDSQVAGTVHESLGVKDLHETLSRRPADAALYNYAAQAHHNHFFWNTLSASPEPISPSHGFRGDIEEHFESMDQLRDELLDSANSIFGNGYVWLMKELTSKKTLRILCTYNAGSPFSGAFSRQQSYDTATGTNMASKLTNPQFAGNFGQYSRNPAVSQPSQLIASPILCLKVWEHQWLPDYGILGKEAYVRNWWDHIDWDVVLGIYNTIPESSGGYAKGKPGAGLSKAVMGSMNRY